jgi:hypothetical protein
VFALQGANRERDENDDGLDAFARGGQREAPLIPASDIMAAMSDVRPGRFYSVDELASVLRVQDKRALHEQLRTMVGDPDGHSTFRLLQGSSDDFYRRISVASTFTLCEPWKTEAS